MSRIENYNWQKFTGYFPKGDSKIGINKSGLIRLSSGFCHDTRVNENNYVVLYFDSSKDALAFKFSKNKQEDAFKVTKDQGGATISGKSFFLGNKLNLNQIAGRYNWEIFDDPQIGSIYIIKIHNEKSI